METNKIPRTYRLDQALDSKLLDAAKSANITRSSVVRNALNEYLNKSSQK